MFLSRGKTKKIIFRKNNQLQNPSEFWNTFPFESYDRSGRGDVVD
jgi:hypothetical protein